MRPAINPLDIPKLRAQFAEARPFRFVVIEGFLDEDFAREVAGAFPTFETAKEMGFAFHAVNERKKVQITDSRYFPASVQRMNDAMASQPFLEDLTAITNIPNLIADEKLVGGGIHVTGPHGRLDVHVDFNLLDDGRQLYRRLNLLLYLNPNWQARWAGEIELWNADVTERAHAYAPMLNRCLMFETSDISFHGVAPLTCPPHEVRRSFAAYYYTKEAPIGYSEAHSTIFRARPDEWMRRYVLMPAERVQRRVGDRVRWLKGRARMAAGRALEPVRGRRSSRP